MRKIDQIKREVREKCTFLGHDLGKFKCVAASVDSKYGTYITTCKSCKGVVKLIHGESVSWWFFRSKDTDGNKYCNAFHCKKIDDIIE